MSKLLKRSFSPIAGLDAEILVLGSMPGEASLIKHQYYAHPRNAFWPIICDILGCEAETTYEARTQALLDHQIALWDVLRCCERTGSLDSNIKSESEEANDFLGFLSEHSELQRICFNGKKAFNSFKKHVLRLSPELSDQYRLVVLPSTSPANASIPMAIKKARWVEALTR